MAGTDRTQELNWRPSPAVILCAPQLGENIGAAARAMANFGLWDLRLVNPRDGWPNEKAIAASAKALHVIEGVRVFDTTEEAVADLTLLLATTARSRDMTKPVLGPAPASQQLAAHINGGQKAGILFGRERWGLSNEEISLADAIVTLPVERAFASLNIAQAVLVLAYEWRQTLGAEALPFAGEKEPPASKASLLGLYEHLEGALDEAGFFKTPAKRPTVIANLRAMLARGSFTEQEVRTLRGVIASLDRRHERPNPTRVQPKSED